MRNDIKVKKSLMGVQTSLKTIKMPTCENTSITNKYNDIYYNA